MLASLGDNSAGPDHNDAQLARRIAQRERDEYLAQAAEERGTPHRYVPQKALTTKGSRYHGLVSVSLANIMKRLMTEANIPAKFLPHSARAAGMAQGKTQGMTDDEVCTRSNVSRPTYTKYYQRQIRTAAYQPPSGIT